MPVGNENMLVDADELLLRQVLPIWIQDGRPASCAFSPNSNDGGHLSTDRGSLITPREAYENYVKSRKSGGVWAVSVGECSNEALSAYDDALEGNPSHAIVDFSGLSKGQQQTKGKKLRAHAAQRGCLHSGDA